jgi:hypothetical protein
MSFTEDFNSCMASTGLPTPVEVFDSLSDAIEFLHQVHDAWETAGGDEEMTLAAFAALGGAATGIDETVLAALGAAAAITVTAYAAQCASCLVSAWVSTGISWSDFLASTDDSWVQGQLTVAAQDQGIDTTTTATA